MKMMFVAAIAIFAATPAFSQAQPGAATAAKPTKAEVEKVVKAIQADKVKSAAYCDMMKLYDDAAKAEDAKDTKKAQELTTKADDAGKKLGGDYEKMMAGLQQVDPQAPEGAELSAILDPLDNSCGGAAPAK